MGSSQCIILGFMNRIILVLTFLLCPMKDMVFFMENIKRCTEYEVIKKEFSSIEDTFKIFNIEINGKKHA